MIVDDPGPRDWFFQLRCLPIFQTLSARRSGLAEDPDVQGRSRINKMVKSTDVLKLLICSENELGHPWSPHLVDIQAPRSGLGAASVELHQEGYFEPCSGTLVTLSQQNF